MILTGYPDFGQPYHFTGGNGYHLFRREGVAILPTSAVIETLDNGSPNLSLQLVRSSTPINAQHNHGVLSIVLRPQFDLNGARLSLSEQGLNLAVKAFDLSNGNATFTSPDVLTTSALGTELESTRTLSRSSLLSHKIIARLSIEAGLFFRDLILGKTMLLDANLTYRLSGVAPRVPTIVKFEPKRLLSFIETLSLCVDGKLLHTQLLDALVQGFPELPIRCSPAVDEDKVRIVCEALVDRLIERFANITEVNADGHLCSTIQASDEFSHAEFSFDLSLPVLAERVLRVTANPFDSIAAVLSPERLGELVQERQLPVIDRARKLLTVNTNLVDEGHSVIAMGGHIYQPSDPPDRLTELSESVDVMADRGQSSVAIHANNGGGVQYRFQGFIAVKTDRGVIFSEGQVNTSNDLSLLLSPLHFSVDVLLFELSRSWCNQMSATLHCSFDYQGKTHRLAKQLDAAEPLLNLVLPHLCENAAIELTLTELGSGNTHRVLCERQPATRIDALLYPECGPQKIVIRGQFGGAESLLVIALLPLGADPAESQANIIHLRPQQPEKVWQWFVASPFQAGIQYQELDQFGNVKGPWRTVKTPVESITIIAGA